MYAINELTCAKQFLVPYELRITSIVGAGATFPYAVYRSWARAYSAVEPHVELTYSGIGSGKGKAALLRGDVAFAGSDSLLTSTERATLGDVQMIPMVIGAVVVVYSIGGVTDNEARLALRRETIASIFLGNITMYLSTCTRTDARMRMHACACTRVHCLHACNWHTQVGRCGDRGRQHSACAKVEGPADMRPASRR